MCIVQVQVSLQAFSLLYYTLLTAPHSVCLRWRSAAADHDALADTRDVVDGQEDESRAWREDVTVRRRSDRQGPPVQGKLGVHEHEPRAGVERVSGESEVHERDCARCEFVSMEYETRVAGKCGRD